MDDKEQSSTFLTFPAEIKQVSSRKLASLDLEYRVVLLTPDPSVLNLGALNADMIVNVSVELQRD